MLNNRKFDLLIHTDVMRKVPVKTQVACPDNEPGCAVVHYSWSPQYSTKIQDAWLIVDKLRNDFSSVEIFIVDGMTNVIVTERFPDGKLKDKHQGYEDTTEKSICYAALKAYGVTI
jgi:hypothetical protein